MKTFLLLISFGIVTLSVGVNEAFTSDYKSSPNTALTETAEDTNLAVFDGFEGDYYFFTDANDKAIQLEKDDHPILSDYKFESGEYIGKEFDIQDTISKSESYR